MGYAYNPKHLTMAIVVWMGLWDLWDAWDLWLWDYGTRGLFCGGQWDYGTAPRIAPSAHIANTKQYYPHLRSLSL